MVHTEGTPDTKQRRAPEPRGTILIVATCAQFGGLIATLLAHEGHATRLLVTGACAPEQVAQIEPDLVLLVEDATPATAMSCCAALRAAPITRDLPIVVVSKYFRRDSRARWAELGADDYLCALFDNLVLTARVADLIARRRRRLAVVASVEPR